MKKILILTITALWVTLSYGSTLGTAPFGLNFKEDVTIAKLWKSQLGAPDSFKVLGEDNLIYYKDNITCYLLIDVLYSIEITEGKYENLEIGMKKRKIIKKVGNLSKMVADTLPTREFLEYRYSESNYILSLEFKEKGWFFFRRSILTGIYIYIKMRHYELK